MKGKILRGKPYRKLIQKVFFQLLLLACFAFVAVMLIRSIGQGKIGNLIVEGIVKIFQVDRHTAGLIYFDKVRQNIEYILLGTMVIFFLLFLRVLLSWFTRYFDEIIGGINELAGGQQKQIIMSPELSFVSDQLNNVNSELIRSAEAEREAEKRKNDLIAFLAHDIKTPLTSVIGYLNLLDESPQLPEEQREKYVRIALEKAYRLELLIGDFFEITRYNLGAIPLQKESVNLSYMMAQIVDEAYPLLITSKKTASVHIPEGLKIAVDPEKMARVFNNILKNAISYSDAGSVIEISGEMWEQGIAIRFENAGTIPRDKLDTIFEKFSRLDGARQTATGGAGLGLAIAKDIVMLHGGTVTVSSEENCTVFTVVLPSGVSA